jgi:hypothetical protein
MVNSRALIASPRFLGRWRETSLEVFRVETEGCPH